MTNTLGAATLNKSRRGKMPARYERTVYQSGECEVDLGRRELRVGGVPVPVGARAFEIIEVLVKSAGDLVTKGDLMDRIWPGAIVEENTLQVHISAVRKALGPHRGLLKTESGRGYCLLSGWTIQQVGAPSAVADPEPIQIAALPSPTNFPASAVTPIGRDVAVQHLRDILSAYRAVTLTGPGGIGKTTLALEVARSLFPSFEGEGRLVELASLADPDFVPSAIATALDLKLNGSEMGPEAVARTIGGRKLLLILDNCEHVIDATARLAETIVLRCPRTTILATSREVLRIGGEYVYRVPPLDVPPAGRDEPDHIIGCSAVELFIARMRAADSNYALRAENLPTLAAICRDLDGIPLAIEFAAARAATLGTEQVAIGLRDRFALLTSGWRTSLPRHQTLRATLNWSYELLAEPERVLLHRLAIFVGAFSLEAAIAVAASLEPMALDLIEGLSSLSAKSLVVFEVQNAIARYRLLDTTRAYALEKLGESGEHESLALRHAEYYRNVLERAELELDSRPTAEWLADYAWRIDNVRAALDWAFSPGGDASIGLALTAAAVPLWMHLSLAAECQERCDGALRKVQSDHTPEMRLRMRLQIGLGNSLLHTRGPSERAQTVLAGALESAEALGDLHAQLHVLLDFSSVSGFRGEYGRAAAASERAKAIAQEIGDTTGVVFADRRVGMILLRTGRLVEAQRHLEYVVHSPPFYRDEDRSPIWQHSDDRAMARAMLARALWLQGFAEKAHYEARASLAEVWSTETTCRVVFYGMGRITPMTGDFATAETAISNMIDSAMSAAAPFWTTAGQFLRGKLLVERRQFAEGLAVLRDAFDICERTNWRISYPEFMGSFALALAGLGRLDEAHDAVCKAIEAAGGGEDGQQWYVPELLRIKGEVLLRQLSNQAAHAAVACFDQAADMARGQGALFWELRAALSAARLRVRQNNPAGAAQALQPVYDRFTEGFDTVDLKEAKHLLDAL
jgi:predicted ATPase/DNA-binding winged helix-turn-helix (wHTH) protein